MFSPFLALHICFVFILHKSSSFLRFKKKNEHLKGKKSSTVDLNMQQCRSLMGRNNFLFYCILFLFLISFLFASVEIFHFFPTTENVYRFKGAGFCHQPWTPFLVWWITATMTSLFHIIGLKMKDWNIKLYMLSCHIQKWEYPCAISLKYKTVHEWNISTT